MSEPLSMVPPDGAPRAGFDGGFVPGGGVLGELADGAVAAGGAWPNASEGERARTRTIGEASENRGIKELSCAWRDR
jgi:hypothetical protein